ncbi:MAG: alpha-L-fucosidase [Bacteroidales bacterium]|nr:alpha-L-fucosidase [Bacteroidales bacterium]
MRNLLLPLIGILAISCTTTVYPDNVNTILVEEDDTPEQIIAKAVDTRPSARQQAAMDDEFIAFVHFGPNTFTGREWGTGAEDPEVFDLKNLDTDQWCRVMKDAGMKKVVLTVKHHDGFVLYQTRYTKHGIMSSGFENGKGDILRALSESCARYGLKLGIYLSPADLYQMEDGGLYGNGSEITMRTIPKLVEGRPFADKRTFNFEVDDYNEYFLSQLFEILTEYGPIDEVWFDGAHPRRKGNQQYNYAAWRELIRTLVPDAVVFGREDIRWCGNESGDTREQEWNVIPYVGENPDKMNSYYDIMDRELGTRKILLGTRKPFWLHYQPGETDTSIRGGWFWRNEDEQPVRTADDVFDIYERSVGGNSIFILNVPPTKDGVLGERDVRTLEEVGKRIRATYGVNLCRRNLKKAVAVGRGLDMKLRKSCKVNRVVLCEPIGYTGERIEKFHIDVMENGRWREVATGANIGHKRIVRFPTTTAERVRVRVSESRAEAVLNVFSAHFYPEKPFNLTSLYSAEGFVTIVPDANAIAWLRNSQNCMSNLNPGARIHYTTDGSEPDENSPLYTEPFKFQNGIVKAISIVGGETGEVYETRIGYDRSNWKIDIRPFETVIDCGESLLLSGFYFISNTDNRNGDYVSRASMSVSTDGRVWKKVADCEFDNIINDPSRRLISIGEPVRARYIRMDVKELVGDGDGFQSRDSDIEAF